MFAPIAILVVVLAIIILPRRIRMERRVRQLLAEHPGVEQTKVYLQFHSVKWSEKHTRRLWQIWQQKVGRF